MKGYASMEDELEGLGEILRAWAQAGVAPNDVAVAVRTNRQRKDIAQALARQGLAIAEPDPGLERAEKGITVATMHNLKGLEYRCVAVCGVGEEMMPLARALTSELEDPLQRSFDMVRERSLLFVACTRARDQLYLSWSEAPSPFLIPIGIDDQHARKPARPAKPST
jgi:superfamily I DNA/RNA helicase